MWHRGASTVSSPSATARPRILQNMLTEGERTELRRTRLDDDSGDHNLPSVSLYRHASDKYREVEPDFLRSVVEYRLDSTDTRHPWVLVGPLYDSPDDEDGYVLRNPSKYQYVRRNVLAELSGGGAKAQQPFCDHNDPYEGALGRRSIPHCTNEDIGAGKGRSNMEGC
jgi:hypothetical protein